MFFKRSNGEFRETDRVTRFKLIKSGKNWLRASTSNFGLLKVIRGQVEETIVAEVREDAGMTGRSFLKGATVAVAVLSLASFVNTSYADELGKDEVVTSAVVSTPAVASEPAALNEQDSKEVLETLNESATETPASTAPSSELVETVPASDDKTILEQNASEAALLNKIAEKYASNHQNTEQKEAINDAVAKVQSELTAGDKLTDTDATAQTYADQRERLSKSVDDMMATLIAAGFEGNTTVNGAPAISAQLDALSTSNTLTAPSVSPTMDQPNGAAIEDPAWNNANYKLDPSADRYTYSIWDLQNWAGPANQGGVTYSNGGYYVTFSVDRATTGTTEAPKVHARLVEKATGKEVEALDMTAKSTYQFKTLVKENPTYAPVFDYTLGEYAQILGTWDNNRDAGPTADDKYKHHILQVLDLAKPGNEGSTKPNVQTKIPREKITHTTYYKVEGTNEELASYSQAGIESQNYKASQPRSFEGYEYTRTDDKKDMSGVLGGIGAKYLELQGGRAHYYVKRIVEQIATDGTSVVKLYALDPSKVSSYNPATDVNTLDLSNYTLVYTSDPVKPGEKPTPAGTAAEPKEVGFVDSKDGQYYLKVATYTASDGGNARLSGWFNKATGDAFTASPQFSADVDPVRNNKSNIIGGNTPGDKASGYPSFFNNFSLPTVKEISTNVTHYYRKSDVKGNVYVHYKDTEGTTIKNSVTAEEQQPINKHYETQNRRPQEIEFQGKTYELVPAGIYKVGEVDEEGHLKSSDPTTGEVAKEDKNVTYVYKLKEKPKGEVVITYVDEKGKEIQKPRQDTPNSPYDTPYNTTEKDEKPNTIKSEDGKTYKIVPKGDYPVGKVDGDGHLESSDPIKGTVDKPKSTITYVYKEVPKGEVVITYVDEKGTEIQKPRQDTPNSPYDTPYNTTEEGEKPNTIEKDGKTYKIVPKGDYPVGKVDGDGHLESSDPIKGTVDKPKSTITYVYKEVPKGEVVITYVDEKGTEIQKPRQDTPNSPYDTPYNTTEEGEKPNTIEKDGKTYKIVPKGDYPVGKVDGDGHLESSDPIKGTVDKPKSTITYVYKEVPKGEVVITYVDEKGTEIQKPRQDTPNSPYDTPYNTTEEGEKPNTIEKDGKTYKIVPKGDYPVGKVDGDGHLESSDPIKGTVDKPKSTITYVYKEVPKGEVVITYVDEKGTEIQKPRQDTPNSPYDTPYNTTEEGEKPNTIEKDGKTYTIVPKGDYPVGKVDGDGHLESSDPIKGTVDKPKSTITYVYKLKEEPKGEVVITYVDEKGTELQKSRQDTPNSPYDTPYNTTEEGEKPNIIEKDGKTYTIVPKGDYPVGKVDEYGHLESSDPIKGTVDKPKSTITYVYKLKEEPKGEVVITYVDEKGTELQKSRQDTPNSPYDTPYNTTEEGEKPNTIEKDGKTYTIVPKGDYPVGKVDEDGHLESSDPIKGKVDKPKSTITYVYKLKEEPKGEVVITYVDEKGTELQKSRQDTPNSPYDTPYNTTEEGEKPNTIEKDGKTYTIVPKGDYPVGKVDEDGHLESSDPIKGKVDKPKSTITYVYKLKEEPKGEVVITYVDEKGTELQKSRQDTPNSPYDTPYNTTEEGEKPNTIEKDGKTYTIVPKGDYPVGKVDGDGHLESSDPIKGKVDKPKSTITYVYKLKEEPKGEVVITYVDEKGTELQKSRQDTPNSPYDTPYNTTEEGEKPNTIEKDGKTYTIVPKGDYPVGKVDEDGHLESSDPIKGKVDKPKSTITYVYKLKEEPKGEVVITYVDEKGTELQKSRQDTPNSPYDTPYNTTEEGEKPNTIEKDGKTYTIVPKGDYPVGKVDEDGHLESSDPIKGKVDKPKSTITYVYKLKEEPKGEVVITYVDEKGTELQKSRQDTPNSPYDTPYNTTEEGEKPNTIEKDGKTYTIVPKGDYPVGKVDEDGHLESSDPIKGKVDKPKSTITYVYKLKEEPKGEVVITYVDEKGTELQKSRQDTPNSPYDTPYNTTEEGEKPNTIEKDGKTYTIVPKGDYPVGKVDGDGHLESSDPIKGKVDKPKSTITYVYKLKEEPKGEVVITYVDEKGTELQKSRQDTPNSPYDTPYNTTEEGEKPNTIEKDGKTYTIVPKGDYPVGKVDEDGHLESSDPIKGKVDKPKSTITYVYKLKEEPKGEVVITYVDEKGTELQKSRQDTPNSPYDTPYNTTEEGEKPNTIEKDGKTYTIVPKGDYPVGKVDEDGHLESSDPIKGKVDKPKSTITYVYKLKEEPKGEVVITYVDEKGTELQKSRQDTPNSPYDTPYNTTEEGEKPNTIEKDGKTYTIVPKGDYPVGKVDEDGHLESSDPIKGKVDKPKSTITYVYKLKEEPTPDKPVEPTPDKPVEPTPDKPVEPTPDKPVEPTPDKPVEPTPDKPVEPTPDKPVEPTPDKPVEPTPDKPVEPTPDKPVEPTPDKPVEPTPDKPVEPTPDKPVEPTPDKPVEPTPDKPVEPTPDKPVEPTPDKPVEPTPDKPVEPTPDKPVEPTPDKPVEPTPDKPVEPTPDKPVNPTPGKPVNPTPGKPVDPTPGKPVNPTPGKPVNPTPGKPVNPTPGKPVDPTPGKPVNPTPGKPVDPTPGKPVNPTPSKPVNPTPGKPVNPTPGKPVDPTPGKPVNPTPSKPVSEQPANPTSDKAQLPNTGETKSAGSTVLGVVAGLVGLAALGRRKKEDEK